MIILGAHLTGAKDCLFVCLFVSSFIILFCSSLWKHILVLLATGSELVLTTNLYIIHAPLYVSKETCICNRRASRDILMNV